MRSIASAYLSDVIVFLCLFCYLFLVSPSLETYLASPDLGYQLSLGWLVRQGQTPFVDFLMCYGPLTAYASALAATLHGNLISEVVVCAAGYALAITIIFKTVRRHAPFRAAAASGLSALFILSRFYKWYYWLFPLAVMYLMINFSETEIHADRKRWVLAAGFIASIGALFRLDLGLALVVFSALLLVFERVRGGLSVRIYTYSAHFSAGFSVPFAVWFIVLVLKGGLRAIGAFFSDVFTGGSGIVQQWSLPFPTLELAWPISMESALFISMLSMVVLYATGLVVGFWRGYLKGRVPLGRTLFASSLMGLGVLPQALHRTDIPHMLQVVWPVCICFPLLTVYVLKSTKTAKPYLTAGLFIFFTISAMALYTASENKPRDLAPIRTNPLDVNRGLARELKDVEGSSFAKVIVAVRDNTSWSDSILDLTLNPQIYYFAERGMSGLLNGYASGFFDSEPWRCMNLKAVLDNPPAVVISREPLDKMGEGHPFRVSHPELYGFLLENYGTVIYDQDNWVVTARNHPLSDAAPQK